MRVLILTPGFAASESDHNCIPPLQLLVKVLKDLGLELEILTLAYPAGPQSYLWHGIPVRAVSRPLPRFLRWFNWWALLREAKRAHHRQAFDRIHSFWLGPCWVIGNRLSRNWNIRHFCTLMGQDVLASNPYRWLLKEAQTRHLIAVSDFQNACFAQSTGKSARQVIPWGISSEGFAPQPIQEQTLDILGCGALIPLKNWSLWLETIAELVKSKPDLRAGLIGEGPEAPALKAYAARLGIAQNVHFHGALPRAEVLAWMRRSRVLLHTATFESFGFVLIEALANGCRVVSTPVGVAPEMAACAQTAPELAALVKKVLAQPQPAPTAPWPSMPDTAEAYLRLYGAEE